MIKNLIISLCSILMCLLIAEGALRVYYSYHLDYQIEMCRYAAKIKRSSSNELSHEHAPNMKAHLMGVDVATNQYGFRDDEYTIEKSLDTFRILLLGDSLTFGWGAEKDCRFGDVLERDLNEYLAQQGKSLRVQVINTGVGNYNTSQEVATYSKRGADFKPDMVVLNYFINDAEPTSTKGRNPIFKYSYLAMWFWGRVDALERAYITDSTFDNYYASLYDDSKPGWQATKHALAELGKMQNRDGFELVMAILPELHAVGPKYGFADVDEKVIAAAHEAGIDRILDLAPNFADENDPISLWVSLDDAHPNCKAHAVIAKGLLDYLTTNNLVR